MHPALRRLIPATFVLIWSSGFIIARYGMPHAEPMTFLFLRFVGVLVIMVPAVMLLQPIWPERRKILHISIAGVLLQAGYLGGVWAAVRHGMSAGLVALIVGLQPIITAWLAALLAEKVTARQWIGLALGLSGVGLVVFAKLSLTGMTALSLGLAVIALASITLGTIYQKKYCPSFDLRAGSVIQFTVSALVCLPFMFLFETREVVWHPEMIGALLWAILALSIGAISLLFILIREGAATQVTSLLYLTPPTTAIMAWFLFDEPITLSTVAGTLLTVWGVWWVMSAGKSTRQ
ncbi:MAG: DMT family transporter [Burkholderiaceae bacterium]|nr:DMT family transporter [Burkholderiaceae bacterium]